MNTQPPKRALLWIAVSGKAQAAEDKASLPSQEADQRALASRNGWQIVDVLRVPGHSRDYMDIHLCAADMLEQGIDAYAKLLKYFETRAFDVLVVRDGSRFARTQSLHAYVTESTIAAGAIIWSLADGQIDVNNYRMWAMVAGFSSSSELDNLKKRNKFGMLKRLELGKPLANSDTLTHSKVRDEKGHVYTYTLREDTRPMWNIVIEGLLQSLSYNQIVQALQNDYAFLPMGEAWYANTLRDCLLNPITWGHLARYYTKKLGIWAFDEYAPLPDGVVVNRNTHTPYWTGDMAARIQNELRRRDEIMRGRAWPQSVSEFSGLVYCGCCGKRMVYRQVRGWQAFSCTPKYDKRLMTYDEPCACTKKSITVDALREALAPRIALLLNGSAVDSTEIVRSYADDTHALTTEFNKLGKELGGLYVQRGIVPPETANFLNAEITQRERRAAVITEELARLKRDASASKALIAANKEAVTALLSVGVANLWALPPARINQLLHGVLRGGRVIVVNGEVDSVRWG